MKRPARIFKDDKGYYIIYNKKKIRISTRVSKRALNKALISLYEKKRKPIKKKWKGFTIYNRNRPKPQGVSTTDVQDSHKRPPPAESKLPPAIGKDYLYTTPQEKVDIQYASRPRSDFVNPPPLKMIEDIKPEVKQPIQPDTSAQSELQQKMTDSFMTQAANFRIMTDERLAKLEAKNNENKYRVVSARKQEIKRTTDREYLDKGWKIWQRENPNSKKTKPIRLGYTFANELVALGKNSESKDEPVQVEHKPELTQEELADINSRNAQQKPDVMEASLQTSLIEPQDIVPDVKPEPEKLVPTKEQQEKLDEIFRMYMKGDGLHKEKDDMGEDEIAEAIKEHKGVFCPVIARNELHLIDTSSNPTFWIMNTEDRGQDGAHWQAVWMDTHDVCFFDSFGRNPDKQTMDELKKMCKDHHYQRKLKINRVVTQDEKSHDCGFQCITFLNNMLNGRKFKEATNFNETDVVKLSERWGYI